MGENYFDQTLKPPEMNEEDFMRNAILQFMFSQPEKVYYLLKELLTSEMFVDDYQGKLFVKVM